MVFKNIDSRLKISGMTGKNGCLIKDFRHKRNEKPFISFVFPPGGREKKSYSTRKKTEKRLNFSSKLNTSSLERSRQKETGKEDKNYWLL